VVSTAWNVGSSIVERREGVTVGRSTTMSLTRRNAGDAASPRSLEGSLAAEVRLGGIRAIANMSEKGATGTGMSRHDAVAVTATVGGVAPRDVAVATGTKDEGDSVDFL
jgi:hypothetical protein